MSKYENNPSLPWDEISEGGNTGELHENNDSTQRETKSLDLIESTKKLIELRKQIEVQSQSTQIEKTNFPFSPEAVTPYEEITDERIKELYWKAKNRELEQPEAGKIQIQKKDNQYYVGYWDLLHSSTDTVTFIQFEKDSEEFIKIMKVIRWLDNPQYQKPIVQNPRPPQERQNGEPEEEREEWWKK